MNDCKFDIQVLVLIEPTESQLL